MTAEQVREALKTYPMLQAIDWYSWKFYEKDAKRAVQYINDMDELAKLKNQSLQIKQNTVLY